MAYILQDYDKTLQDIMETGETIPNRTGIDCLVKFGIRCEFDISEFFPIPTRRKYPVKSILAELIWMLSGSTNVHDLEAMGSKIWTFWISEEFEKRNGYESGELGPAYGWQFRHAGGQYPNKETGFDQVSNVIEELKRDKYSRRVMINLWNPVDMYSDKVRLPCCHYNFVLMVNSKDQLIGILNQRSGDWLPGISANIVFYSALIYMIAAQTGLKPGKLVHNCSNAHVYVSQQNAAETYLKSPIFDNPTLTLNKKESIFDYKIEDFIFSKYEFGEKIIIPVVV